MIYQQLFFRFSVFSFGGFGMLVFALACSANLISLAQDPPAENLQIQRRLAAESIEYFETHIRPALVEHCYQCHSSESKIVQGGLLVDSAERMRQGGDSGELYVPGQSDQSLLMAVLNWEQYEMPPAGKLPDQTIQHFKNWIEMGAPDPRVEQQTGEKELSPNPANHWAFQLPEKAEPPQVNLEQLSGVDDWPLTENAEIAEIDRFILDSLQRADLEPSARAEPRFLLRRLHFVLTGLPPSYEEYAAFESLTDHELNVAYLQTVDRLLDSPQFGQRWGRHWLDVSRYADTKGYVFQEDRNYYQAYRYRDWVVDAFNADLPYDQFIVSQLAADSMDNPASKPAMGFLTLGRRFINNQQDIIDDRIDVMTRGLMGLTVSCARCHDHKYDPIPIDDYYSLYGVFASCYEPKPPISSNEGGDNEIASDADSVQTNLQTDQEWTSDDWLTLRDADQPFDPIVFIRGNLHNPGDAVPRQFLSILSAETRTPFQQGSGRWEMAQAIASPQNPLTARVWVNRVWMHLMGEGLVTTPSDFGTRGELPSHPELLDWLTCRFIEQGWSTKWLIREILLSRTFCQSSSSKETASLIDPENRLLWRMNRRRLDWETMRDSLLLAAGDLDDSLGGVAVDITTHPFSRRRTLYGFIDRQNLPGQFRTFDFANPDNHVPKRPYTVVPQQALFLMNSPFVIEQATKLAIRIEEISQKSDAEKVAALFKQVLGREPKQAELNAAIEFVTDSQTSEESSVKAIEGDPTDRLNRWQQLAQVLLMTNEFMFID